MEPHIFFSTRSKVTIVVGSWVGLVGSFSTPTSGDLKSTTHYTPIKTTKQTNKIAMPAVCVCGVVGGMK